MEESEDQIIDQTAVEDVEQLRALVPKGRACFEMGDVKVGRSSGASDTVDTEGGAKTKDGKGRTCRLAVEKRL